MVKCLKCGEEIYTINWRYPSMTKGFLMKDGGTIRRIEDETACLGDLEFACPLCDAVLFAEYRDAAPFLMGQHAEKKETVERRSGSNPEIELIYEAGDTEAAAEIP